MLRRLFFTQLSASERKQIAFMADEKLSAQVSHRLFATNRERMENNMNKINYQKILDKTIDEISASDKVPTLLLHSCCAPCSSYVLEYLSQYFSITVLYYNPNIFPKEEYEYN